ncbi:MAG: hypothetical protein Q8Q39_02220 [bacterium]|nr:hypothetical protein [bacterium]
METLLALLFFAIVIGGSGILLYDAIQKLAGLRKGFYIGYTLAIIVGASAFLSSELGNYRNGIIEMIAGIAFLFTLLASLVSFADSIRESRRITLPHIYVIICLLWLITIFYFVVNQNSSSHTVVTP